MNRPSQSFLTFGAVARMLGVRPSVIGLLIKKGSLPEPVTVGNMKYFLRAEVEKMVAGLQTRSRKAGRSHGRAGGLREIHFR